MARQAEVGRGQARVLKGKRMHDIDIESIEPGSVLSQSDCDQLFGFAYETNPVEWQFKLMQLSDYVERELHKANRVLTVVCEGRTVRVLTHEEASIYNQKHFDNAIKKMRKCNRRKQAVDVSTLNEDQRKSHDNGLLRQSRILQAVKQVSKDVKPEVRRLDRPVMFRKVGTQECIK